MACAVEMFRLNANDPFEDTETTLGLLGGCTDSFVSMPTIRSRILKLSRHRHRQPRPVGLNANDPFEDTETVMMSKSRPR